MANDFYTSAPSDHPLNDIIRDNQLLYSKLDTFTTDVAKKLFLHELRAYIRRYARSDGESLRFTIPDPLTLYYVDDLLAKIEAEMEFCEERIRFSGLVPQQPAILTPEQEETDEVTNNKTSLYGNGREVARFILAAERARALPMALPTANITTCFGIKETTYKPEYRRLKGNYTPPKLSLVQTFLEQWLVNMSNDELESIILTVRKLQA